MGRKWILAITGPLSALTLVIVAFVVDIPSAAVFWLLVFGFVVQVAIPVLYTYVSELYPTELRGTGFGWASTFSRLGAGFGPLIFATTSGRSWAWRRPSPWPAGWCCCRCCGWRSSPPRPSSARLDVGSLSSPLPN